MSCDIDYAATVMSSVEVACWVMGAENPDGSTSRFGLEAAPGGLCLAQDLLNTAALAAAVLPDLLADVATARPWLDESLRRWSDQTGQSRPSIAIGKKDLPALRELREVTHGWLSHEVTDHPPRHVQVNVVHRDARLIYQPDGLGAAGVASLVTLEILLASRTGTLRRLKLCLNPACRAAFYDLSRNGTRVWHDKETCGNAINLRASRARRRESSGL